ncbi:hypothetical protein MPSEU_000445000 [Mayamaea pseudoterrestris]|nr:hypothetical protein MPSEU_000445000 [Mayamaea pseudoterrestris]
MYADLFDQLGAGRNASSRNVRTATTPETPPLVSFHAGKMNLEWDSSNASYQCTPDTARGQVQLVWNTESNCLEWEWMDRRDKRVVDKFPIASSSDSVTSFERITIDSNSSNKHKNDRIYVWTHGEGAYRMYWMQDESADKDDDIVAQVNQYLTDPASAAPVGASTTVTSGDAAVGANAGGGTAAAAAGSASPSTLQVDALSNILQNLGMPPADSASATSTPPQQQQQLTLADLQGAMAQVNNASTSRGPSLDNLVSPAAITSLLQDADASARLLELLPPGQQTMEHLEENLRSPQVQSTLRTLTMAVLPDANTGANDGLVSLLANFQLPSPTDPAAAQRNPIQAFLEAIVAQVEAEQQQSEGGTNEHAAAADEGKNDDEDSPMAE